MDGDTQSIIDMLKASWDEEELVNIVEMKNEYDPLLLIFSLDIRMPLRYLAFNSLRFKNGIKTLIT